VAKEIMAAKRHICNDNLALAASLSGAARKRGGVCWHRRIYSGHLRQHENAVINSGVARLCGGISRGGGISEKLPISAWR